MVKQMTKAKSQPAVDMPVTARNAAKTDAQRAVSTIRLLKAKHGSFAAISHELKNEGHEVNRGLLCAVMNGKRLPSRELLIALGIRKPPRVLSEAERETRKAERQIAGRMRLLYAYANAHCEVTLERLDTHWQVSITPRQIWGMQLISAVRDVSMIVAIDGAIAAVEEWSKHRYDKTN